ncbi:MAG: hypothetical protein HQL03_14425 [Nitrospirae bacterium]|nr:hypothetical protein [Nitrospirota bacterium]MBF0591441.1 hypothetical protein [Nitrospirota bacterium]
MSVLTIPKALSDKLGDEATNAFIKFINEAGIDTRRELATKEDISKVKEEITRLKEEVLKVESRLSERIVKLDGEFTLVKWMIGVVLAGIVSLIMKAFFMH